MKMDLDDVAVRVLGSLVEKELTTPEYYPLSLNGLTTACRQKSNRNPVLSLEEADVTGALDMLAKKGLARSTATGSRVAKYCHCLSDKLGLTVAQRAILAELMLRGPQTAGELRTRAERLTPFPDLAATETILRELMEFGPPLVARLPRQSGRKEQRYSHLLSGQPQLLSEDGDADGEFPRTAAETPGRVELLDGEVEALRRDIVELRQKVQELKEMF